MKGRPTRERMGFAMAGIVAGWRREHSLRVYGRIVVGTLVVLLLLRPAPVWWAAFGIVAGLVTATELVNGAMEALIDHLHPGLHPEIKAVKDMLSGAVMLAGAAALVVAAAFVVDQAPRWWAMLGGVR